MKFTDEQLSRVLTAHEAGGLRRVGSWHSKAYPACMIQAAQPSKLHTDPFTFHVHWFDHNYTQEWTADEFLEQLEARGLA